MNVAVMRTKAEQGLGEAFEGALARLPGGEGVADLRRDAMGLFLTLGLPHRRVEAWKYTDLRAALKDAPGLSIGETKDVGAADVDRALGALAELDATRVVFVNGRHRADLSRSAEVAGLQVAALGRTLAAGQDKAGTGLVRLARDDEAVIALNSALAADGAVVRIPARARPDVPLLLVFLSAGGEAGALHAVRNVISVGAGAAVTILEVHAGLDGPSPCHQNALSDIAVGKGAQVSHLKLTRNAGATHVASWIVSLGAEARYRGFQLTLDSTLVRNQVFATFEGEGAVLDVSGGFLTRAGEHVDTTLLIDHAVAGCQSRELFKGVLSGASRGVFQGKVIVRPHAQKSDGKQMAQALMLSPEAEFDSKPELEIYADDVVCGHGSTTAEIDPDQIFYCEARGIPEAVAKAMLMEAFIGEAIDKVEHEPIRDALLATTQDWLVRLGG